MVHIEARSAQNDEKIKTVDTNGWIVFDTQVDVFLNAKTEVSCVREILFSQLVFFDLDSEELDLMTFYFPRVLTFNPFSKISSAFGPRTVQ